jgi:hypothetical protein
MWVWAGLAALATGFLSLTAEELSRSSGQVSVKWDPLLDRSFLELPVATVAVEADSAAAKDPARHRLQAMRLRTRLSEERAESIWRMRTTNNVSVTVYAGHTRHWGYPAINLYDPWWYWGPGSSWWIRHGPGTIENPDSAFPEFGRYHPAAFFKPPQPLPKFQLAPPTSAPSQEKSTEAFPVPMPRVTDTTLPRPAVP